MRLTISPRAARDLEAIADYIAVDSPRRAGEFIQQIKKQCFTIANNPISYRQRPELGADIRSCVFGNYVIFFSTTASEMKVVRILHGARNIEAIFSEKK